MMMLGKYFWKNPKKNSYQTLDRSLQAQYNFNRMNKTLSVILATVGIFVFLIAFIGISYVSASNKEIALRAQFNAQDTKLPTIYDNTFKVIQEQAGVSQEYEKSFKENYQAIMQGRYGVSGDKALMKWIQESTPNYSTALFEKVANSVQEQRNTFTYEESKAIDIKREHDQLLNQFPSSIFVGGRPALVLHLVTSNRTEKAFQTGKDEPINMFGRNK